MVDFTDKIPLNTFSLLPAPLHVAYRDNEDDDLEKAYKEVCTDGHVGVITFACFKRSITRHTVREARNVVVFCLVEGFSCEERASTLWKTTRMDS